MNDSSSLDQATVLAGYLLGHMANLVASESVSLLTPFSIGLADDGSLATQFHTGSSQAAAIQEAKEVLAKNESGHLAWAFGREGRIERGASVVSISAWAHGLDAPIEVIQQFTREPEFHLLDETMFALSQQILEGEQATRLLEQLQFGISRHPEAGARWSNWRRAVA